MKKIALAILLFGTLQAGAQQNVFFNQDFWKGNPDVQTIKAEMAKGSSPSQLTAASYDATVYAINNNVALESILFLLSQPGNEVNKLTHDGRTYLFWAASRGNLPLMEHLIKNGAKVNMQDSHGNSPLLFAVNGGQRNTKVFDLLIEKGLPLKTDLNQEGANALLLAIPNDADLALTTYFIAKGLDLHSKDAAGNTAFNYAARSGNMALMNTLLAKGVKPTDQAILMAASGTRQVTNGLAVFQYLESLKLKPTVTGSNNETALFQIARKPKQEEVISYFISKGVDVNHQDREGNTAFMLAATSNTDVNTLALLLKNLKSINQVNAKGQSALTMAVRSNAAEVVKWLMDNGASATIVDKDGDNLVAHLVQTYNARNAEVFETKLKLLRDKGLNVAAPQQNGNTWYHLAVAKNDMSLLKRAKELQVDINYKNKEGYTALHKAALIARDAVLLNQLLEQGAGKGLTTGFNETAYDLAKENDYLMKQNVNLNFLKP